MSSHAITTQVAKRIAANQQRVEKAREREDRERAAIIALKRADREEDKAILQGLRADIEKPAKEGSHDEEAKQHI